jgi:hypothetical protein
MPLLPESVLPFVDGMITDFLHEEAKEPDVLQNRGYYGLSLPIWKMEEEDLKSRASWFAYKILKSDEFRGALLDVGEEFLLCWLQFTPLLLRV